MATNIRDNLELVLAGYEQARKTDTFGGKHELWSVFDALKRNFAGSPSVVSRPTVRVVWSVGKGNWAKVPWISFLDERGTNTTRRGVYCVYLFRQDMSGLYLAFQQGVTEEKEQHGKLEAHKRLRKKAADLRSICGHLAEQDFRLDDEIDLHADPGLGTDYESSTVAYKFYEADAVPGDETLLKDLEAVLQTYDWYLADEKWINALNLCSLRLQDRTAFDAEDIDYKLMIAERIRAALDPKVPPEEFGPLLRKTFANSYNNLTNWQAHDRFTSWAAENPHEAQRAVGFLLEDKPVEQRIDRFLDRIPNEAASGLSTRVSIASFLLMGLNSTKYPMYRPTPFDQVERLLGWPRVLDDRSPGEVYAHHRAFAQRFLEELRRIGLDARDMLDAQSLIWILASSEDPAFALWRGEEVDAQKRESQTTDTNSALEQELATTRPKAPQIVAKTQSGNELDYQISSSYPFPIAFGFRSLMSIVDYRDLYREQLRIAENILAFLASVSLALLRKRDRESVDIDLKEYWRSGISPGDWKEIAGRCSKVFGTYEDNPLALGISSLNIRSEKKGFGHDVTKLIQAKNDYKHDRGPTISEDIAEASREVQERLKGCMEKLSFFSAYPIRQVEDFDVSRSGDEFYLKCLRYMGDHPSLLQEEVVFHKGLRRGDLFLDLDGQNWVPLYPFIVPMTCSHCKARETYLIDLWDSRKGTVRMKSFERGHTMSNTAVSDVLAQWNK